MDWRSMLRGYSGMTLTIFAISFSLCCIHLSCEASNSVYGSAPRPLPSQHFRKRKSYIVPARYRRFDSCLNVVDPFRTATAFL
jgi:hypothetical protein